MKIKRWMIWSVVACLLFLCLVIPYIKVEILTVNADEKLKDFDLSCFDNVYFQGTPPVYDCKIYSYHKEESAQVFYVFGDCEIAVMVDLEWDKKQDCWSLVDGQTMWSTWGGSADEFCWPLYYPDKLFGWVGFD